MNGKIFSRCVVVGAASGACVATAIVCPFPPGGSSGRHGESRHRPTARRDVFRHFRDHTRASVAVGVRNGDQGHRFHVPSTSLGQADFGARPDPRAHGAMYTETFSSSSNIQGTYLNTAPSFTTSSTLDDVNVPTLTRRRTVSISCRNLASNCRRGAVRKGV